MKITEGWGITESDIFVPFLGVRFPRAPNHHHAPDRAGTEQQQIGDRPDRVADQGEHQHRWRRMDSKFQFRAR
jgi:hypothetical protein